MTLALDIKAARLLDRLGHLRRIGATATGGVTREAYGPLDVEARTMVAGWMEEAGLTTTVDAAANLIGVRRGSAQQAGQLAMGSHLDTVVDGGHLDGVYGVLAAIEVADALRSSAIRHELLVAAFANEEGARGTGGMVGSRAVTGGVEHDELAFTDDEGTMLATRMEQAGGAPDRLGSACWDLTSVTAFVELHIEQGPILERAGARIGVVEGITGRQSVDVTVVGVPNHAGTTMMGDRRDAATAAAEIVLAVEALAIDGVVRVATAGYIEIDPNVRNVVPGRALVSAEFRDSRADALADACDWLDSALADVALRRGVGITATWRQRLDPTFCHPDVVRVIGERAHAADLRSLRLWSGAGHDTQVLGRAVPTGMIFVPSVGGVSHAPGERTAAADLVAGARVLLETIRCLDEVGCGLSPLEEAPE